MNELVDAAVQQEECQDGEMMLKDGKDGATVVDVGTMRLINYGGVADQLHSAVEFHHLDIQMSFPR